MWKFECLFSWKVVDGIDFRELEPPIAFLGESVNPNSGTQPVVADEVGRDKNVFRALFKFLFGHAKEAKPFGGQFEHAIYLNGVTCEDDGAFRWAFAALVVVPVVSIIPVVFIVSVIPILLIVASVSLVALASALATILGIVIVSLVAVAAISLVVVP